jgi:hypothetical protein
MKSIGFTGTRKGLTPEQTSSLKTVLHVLAEVSDDVRATEFHHGDCVGADEKAATIALAEAFFVVAHPSTLENQRAFFAGNSLSFAPKEPLIRNHDIVDQSEILIATPHGHSEELRSGTWATIRYAWKVGAKVLIIYPNGSVS